MSEEKKSKAGFSFKATARFCGAISLLNNIAMSEENNANFLPFIKKIFSSMKRQTDSSKTQQIAIFSDDEMDQLHNSFILTLQDLTLIVDCCCFILEQAIYSNVKAEDLFAALIDAGFDDSCAQVIVRNWKQSSPELVARQKEVHSSIGYRSLQDSDYRVHISTAHSGLSRLQTPLAILHLELSNNNPLSDNRLNLELDQNELTSFFEQLERVQNQLDLLG